MRGQWWNYQSSLLQCSWRLLAVSHPWCTPLPLALQSDFVEVKLKLQRALPIVVLQHGSCLQPPDGMLSA